MKILVATKDTQGQRRNDFMWCREGDIVKFGTECDGEDIDGRCGCRRAMTGVESNSSTTTMKVVDLDITKEKLTEAVRGNYRKGGWYKLMGSEGAEEHIKKEVEELIRVAGTFTVGNIVEKRGNKLQSRQISRINTR
jgi:hypothetical protein